MTVKLNKEEKTYNYTVKVEGQKELEGSFANFKWNLKGDTLTISGTGSVDLPGDAPWEAFRGSIKKL
jgi:thiamine pyrophosphokinase